MTEEQSKTWTETIRVEGGQLLDKVRELIHEGNVRQISIKQGDRVIVSLPLTLGVVAAVIAPMLAAVGAIAALVTDCSIEIERSETVREAEPGEPGGEVDQPLIESVEPEGTAD
jgi:non-ribosomal peptide synthetase component E (peptide arylation enzyme)